MLPSFLFPSYKQYKTDSNAVATWLANSALQCGYPADLLTNQASQQKPPKLKGRARKLARDAAHNKSPDGQNNGPKSTTAPEEPKYLIAVHDFVTLAEWIAKSTKPLLKAPASFISVLDRAIIVRKRHYSWWYDQSDTSDGDQETGRQANESHVYFIGVLERVRDILQPSRPADALKDTWEQPLEGTSSSKASAKGHLVNLFGELHIEEPSDEFLNSEPLSSDQNSPTPRQIQYGVSQGPQIQEVYFAVHCLLSDMYNIRKYLKEAWKGYKRGAAHLVPIALTTNTAIDFARRLADDFVEKFPNHADFEEHMNVLYVLHCQSHGQDPAYKQRPDDEMNFAVYDDAEVTLFPAYMLLSSFNKLIKPDVLLVSKPDHWGAYDPSSNRSSKSPREKFQEDKAILLSILPDFCILAEADGGVPAEDEMTRGISKMVKSRIIPIWLAFSAQIFLDIHHILREQVSRGFFDLKASAVYVEFNIRHVLEFHKNLRIDNWPESNDKGLFQILDRITHWVNTDVIEDSRTRFLRNSPFTPPPVEPFRFFKQHPLYCGLLSYNLLALTQEASIVFANAWGSILYSAHLYNALRQERLLLTTWQDMDLACLLHRTEDMFIGDFPNTHEDYVKRFDLAMGYSPTMFAKDRRRGRAKGSKAGPRTLNDLSPVSGMFKKRYCYNDGRINLSPNDVDMILKKYADQDDADDLEESGQQRDPGKKSSSPVAPGTAPRSSKSQSAKTPVRSKKRGKSAKTGVGPADLLHALLRALQSEMLELTFNHFRLHTNCWRFLRRLKDALEDDLRELYGPDWLERENQLAFIVGFIFMTVLQTSRRWAEVASETKMKIRVTSRMLARAGDVLEELLKEGCGGFELYLLEKAFGFKVELPDFLEIAGAVVKEA